MAAKANLQSRLTMDDAQFSRSIDKAKQKAVDFGKNLNGALNTAGAFVGISTGLNLISESLAKFDRVGKLATRFDADVEAVQRLGFAAEQNGADLEVLANALTRAGRKASDLEKNVAIGPALKRLGVDVESFVKAFNTGDLESQVGQLADAWVSAADRGQALSDLFTVLEDDAKNLVPLLENGAAGIRELGESIETLDADQIKNIEKYNDSINRLSTNIQVATGVVLDFAFTAIEGVTKALGRSVVMISEFASALSDGQGLGEAAKSVQRVIKQMSATEAAEENAARAGKKLANSLQEVEEAASKAVTEAEKLESIRIAAIDDAVQQFKKLNKEISVFAKEGGAGLRRFRDQFRIQQQAEKFRDDLTKAGIGFDIASSKSEEFARKLLKLNDAQKQLKFSDAKEEIENLQRQIDAFQAGGQEGLDLLKGKLGEERQVDAFRKKLEQIGVGQEAINVETDAYAKKLAQLNDLLRANKDGVEDQTEAIKKRNQAEADGLREQLNALGSIDDRQALLESRAIDRVSDQFDRDTSAFDKFFKNPNGAPIPNFEKENPDKRIGTSQENLGRAEQRVEEKIEKLNESIKHQTEQIEKHQKTLDANLTIG